MANDKTPGDKFASSDQNIPGITGPESAEDYWRRVYPPGEPRPRVSFHNALPALFKPDRYGRHG